MTDGGVKHITEGGDGDRAPIDGRHERSRRTRARVLAAAHDLFVELGYDRASIEAIAAQAGVATQTVYNLFHTKHALLAAVLGVAIAGDDMPVPIVERPWFDGIERRAAATVVTDFAVAGAAVVARAAPVYDVVRRAASHPEIGQLLDDTRRRRRADQAQLVARLAAAGHLRAGLGVTTAADITYALMNEEVFLLLTGDCGWALARFERWLAAALVAQLCP